MSSTEIEDVLSSIRRLVSEEMRPLVRSRPAPTSASAPADTGKLILTPALRIVSQPAPNLAQAPAPQPAEPIILVDSRGSVPKPAEPLPVFVATRRVHLVEADEAPFIEAEPAPIEQVVASLGAAVTAQPEDWEPEHGDAPIETGLIGEAWAMPEINFALELDEDDPRPAPAAAVAKPQPEPAPLLIVEDVPAWAQDDSDQQLEAAAVDEVEFVHGSSEPDADWADAAEASVIASLQAEADGVQARQTATVEAEDDDELRFNEDVLRELVRDILREELAGPMGERITRNIRKLVRSEISTLIAARELD